MHKPTSVRREIIAILIIKLILILLIKWCFFSDPTKPGGHETAVMLLSSSATPPLSVRSNVNE